MQESTQFGTAANSPTTTSATTDVFQYSVFSDGQQITLLVVGLLSAVFSLFGSSSIVYLIFKSNKHKKRGLIGQRGGTGHVSSHHGNGGTRSQDRVGGSVYHRILLGLCLSDMVTSISFITQPFAMLQSTGFLFARGTVQTCTASAFFSRFYQATVFYNFFLNVYFLLSVKYQKTEAEIANLLEPYTHFASLAVPLAFAGLAAAKDILNPLAYFGVCGVDLYPANCYFNQDVPCIRGSPNAYIVMIVEAGISVLVATFGIYCTWTVFWTVRKQLKGNTISAERRTRISAEYNQEELRKQYKRHRIVARQAMLYTLAYIPVMLLIITRILVYWGYVRALAHGDKNNVDYAGLYASVWFIWFFVPGQGFLNWFIYVHRAVRAWKKLYYDKSWLHAYRQVLSGKPPPTQREIALAKRQREVLEQQQQQQQQQQQVPEEEQDEQPQEKERESDRIPSSRISHNEENGNGDKVPVKVPGVFSSSDDDDDMDDPFE